MYCCEWYQTQIINLIKIYTWHGTDINHKSVKVQMNISTFSVEISKYKWLTHIRIETPNQSQSKFKTHWCLINHEITINLITPAS
jgi:hypothetical protein